HVGSHPVTERDERRPAGPAATTVAAGQVATPENERPIAAGPFIFGCHGLPPCARRVGPDTLRVLRVLRGDPWTGHPRDSLDSREHGPAQLAANDRTCRAARRPSRARSRDR